jgi:hypothetical protein
MAQVLEISLPKWLIFLKVMTKELAVQSLTERVDYSSMLHFPLRWSEAGYVRQTDEERSLAGTPDRKRRDLRKAARNGRNRCGGSSFQRRLQPWKGAAVARCSESANS